MKYNKIFSSLLLAVAVLRALLLAVAALRALGWGIAAVVARRFGEQAAEQPLSAAAEQEQKHHDSTNDIECHAVAQR